MALAPGSRLGVYEVSAEIGAGGMGIVYRTRDTKLGRDVALKILPDLFADDPERLARFQREARVLAPLSHPVRESSEVETSHAWRPFSCGSDQRVAGARHVSKRRCLSVAVACLSLLWALDAPVSGQAVPEAPFGASVLGVAIDGPPPPVPPAVVSRDAEGRVTLRAIRLERPLNLDGRLDDAIYQRVLPVSDFIQQVPDEGEPATEQTEAWVFFDDENLYVSARCWDSHPERIVANEMRRDNNNIALGNANFAVVLDTFYDRRNGYAFQTTPLGALRDQTFTNEGNFDSDWNTVWQPRTARFSDGWTTEIAIPFKSLRYGGAGPQVWSINMRRIVRWKNEHSYLSAVPASYRNSGMYKVSSAATLVGLETPPRSLNLEVKPYAISGVRTDRTALVPVSNDVTGDAGVDVKYGVTQSLTADFTYNTDFAQVEDDEQRINLTRFNLFFPEKREFFLEGRGIFDFGGGGGPTPILFFSRRIGLDRGSPVPIKAGGRLTGKVGPYSIGVLNIQTGDEPVAGARDTNFSVVRVKRDVLRRSSIGALMTRRSVSTVGDGSNDVFGVDGAFAFFENVRIDTYLARTRTPGLSGDDTSYRARLDYNGDRYGVILDRLAVGDNFNPEVGFLRRDDFRTNFAFVRFSPRPRSLAAVRQFNWDASYNYLTDGAGRLETRSVQGSFFTEFENSDGLSIGYDRRYEFVERPFPIAPGVTIPVGGYSFQNVFMGYRLGQQRKIAGGLFYERGGFFGGEKSAVEFFGGRVEVTPQITLEPSFSFNWIDLPQGTFTTQVVRTRAVYTLTPRMFFSGLVQYNSSSESLSSNLRLRWEYQPGSELFVVYSEGRDTEVRNFPGLENRAFVVKFNRLFRF